MLEGLWALAREAVAIGKFCVCVCLSVSLCLSETGSHCLALASLELTTRLALNFRSSRVLASQACTTTSG